MKNKTFTDSTRGCSNMGNDKAVRRNPFQCTDAEALKAYETALQNYSKHAKAVINRFNNEQAIATATK